MASAASRSVGMKRRRPEEDRSIRVDVDEPLSGDDSEFGSGSEDGGSDVGDAAPQPEVQAVEADETKKVKAVRKLAPRPKFTKDILRGPMGLDKLLKDFPKIKFYGEGYETKDLQKIMRVYREWAYHMFPKESFERIVNRIEKFGSTREFKNILHDYRAAARGESKFPIEQDSVTLGSPDARAAVAPSLDNGGGVVANGGAAAAAHQSNYEEWEQMMAESFGDAIMAGGDPEPPMLPKGPVAVSAVPAAPSQGSVDIPALPASPPRPAPSTDRVQLTEEQKRMIAEKRAAALARLAVTQSARVR